MIPAGASGSAAGRRVEADAHRVEPTDGRQALAPQRGGVARVLDVAAAGQRPLGCLVGGEAGDAGDGIAAGMVEQHVPHRVVHRRRDVGVGRHLVPDGVVEHRDETQGRTGVVDGHPGPVGQVGLGRGEHPLDVGPGGVRLVDDGRLALARDDVEDVDVDGQVHGSQRGHAVEHGRAAGPVHRISVVALPDLGSRERFGPRSGWMRV